MIKKLALVTVLAVLAIVQVGPVAHAQEMPALLVREEAGITWADASTDGGNVRVVFLTPKSEKGRRQLWQACRFSSTLAGTYQCGIDTSSGSLASNREGAWLVKVFIDGTLGARGTFAL